MTRFRKADHIRICRDEDVRSENVTTGFARWRLPHDALPELDKREIELRTELFGRPLAAPLLISCMTGGSELARRINERLARAAQRFGIALGLGSGRALLVDPSLRDTFAVRPLCPDVPLLANLGAVQLNYGVGLDDCRRLVELLEADALVLHLNPLQEAVQPEGDVDFRGLRDKIARLAEALEVPVILKEVGNGLGAGLARWAASTAIAGLDTAGTGGTSWARVESYRAGDSVLERLGRSFSGWGVPTAQSVLACRAALPDRLVIASGGIRNGIEAAKAIALGADLVGIARPFLQAASESEPALADEITLVIEQLRVAMFCSGCRDLAALRRLELEPVADRGDATTETGRSYR
ncbi:MAG: type 2 isopentenyl-diphosphate Delta-isomerase [Planctomycetota bacterium]|nr:MAG: type 2 isopentenyl-diphosphate Delta-isomerase [Planctomycetota bacterium]